MSDTDKKPETISVAEAIELAREIHDRLDAEIEEGRLADAKRLECSECAELRADIQQLEGALIDIFAIAVQKLTCQSRLTEAQTGIEITEIVYDALGKERLDALLDVRHNTQMD
jgi:hypothetical protein